MSTVAIICEYNPFHTGHLHHINEIRREFGEDTVILALMSGNFTQRGEPAIIDKSTRARCAVDSGVNLCLELPFPYSMGSAELFATSAVGILNALGTVDYLSFGSECGDIELLERTAELSSCAEYEATLRALIESKELSDGGYPVLCEQALRSVVNGAFDYAPMKPNNILAIEYIKALKSTSSSIKPHTVKRSGAGYSAATITSHEHQSASAIRGLLLECDNSAFDYIPKSAKDTVSSAITSGYAPCIDERVAPAVISHFRLNPAPTNSDVHDVGGGLYNRLRAKSFETNTITNLIQLSKTKKYTSARLKRAIWYSFFGVTSSEIKEPPAYTSLLAMDDIGRAELKRIKQGSDFPILTKPSATQALPDNALRQKTNSDKADSVYQLMRPTLVNGNFTLTASPYVKR